MAAAAAGRSISATTAAKISEALEAHPPLAGLRDLIEVERPPERRGRRREQR